MARPRARTLIPWLVGGGALLWVALTIPLAKVGAALEHVSWWRIGVIGVLYVMGLWLADSFAMWIGFRMALRVPIKIKDVLLLRGASFLLALVNYGAGQGGVVWFLHRRHGVPLATATGAVLLTTGAFMLVVVGAVAAGIGLNAVPQAHELKPVVWLVAAGLPIYLGIVWWAPPFLNRYRLLQPLFAAGVRGTLAATAVRTVHLGVLLTSHWFAYRQFGIEMPVEVALVALPIIFLVAALPLAPAGLGTAQATAVALLAPYVVGADGPSTVVAASLGFQAVATIVMALIGLWCLRVEAKPEDDAEVAPPQP